MSARILWTVALLGSIACGCHAMHHRGPRESMSCACTCDRGDHPRDQRMQPRPEAPREMREVEENEGDEGDESEEHVRAVPGMSLEPGQSLRIEADSGGQTFTLPMNGMIKIQSGSGDENEESEESENDESGEQDGIVLQQDGGGEPLRVELSDDGAAGQDPAERAKLEEKIRRYLQDHGGASGTIVMQDGDEGAYLGVATDVVDGRVIVTQVMPDTAAAAAGLQANDELKSFDGHQAASSEALHELVSSKKPGDEVEVIVRRGGQDVSLKAKLGSHPQQVVQLGGAKPRAPTRFETPQTPAANDLAKLRSEIANLRKELREVKQMLKKALAKPSERGGERR